MQGTHNSSQQDVLGCPAVLVSKGRLQTAVMLAAETGLAMPAVLPRLLWPKASAVQELSDNNGGSKSKAKQQPVTVARQGCHMLRIAERLMIRTDVQGRALLNEVTDQLTW